MESCLGGGVKNVLFSSLVGEDFHFDYYFSNGLNHQPVVDLKEFELGKL